MIGLWVAAVGYVAVVVALVLMFGVWPLIPSGAFLSVCGVVVDFDRFRGGVTRAKRSVPASR